MTSIHIKCVFFLRLISNWYFFSVLPYQGRGEKWANEVWILSQRTTLYSTLEPLTLSAQTRNSSLWSETDFFFGKFPWVNKVFIIIVRTRGNLTPVNFSSSFLFGVFQCGKEMSCCRRRVYQYEMDEWHATSGMKKIFQYFLRQNTPTEPKRCQTRQTYESKSI